MFLFQVVYDFFVKSPEMNITEDNSYFTCAQMNRLE